MRHLTTEPQDCYFAPSDADFAEMCEINAELNDEFFDYFDENFDEHDDYYDRVLFF